MRAKRSKKYRKLMHQYELSFGFREPYQVLVDSNFLRAVHSFKMDLIPALERTLQGKVKPLLTKCSLAAIMASQPINPKTDSPYRPTHLPPPTTLPLRHCSHNPDSTPLDEIDCLLSLLSPNPDAKKNKEHYILATADPHAPKTTPEESTSTSAAGKKRKRGAVPDEGQEAMARAKALRVRARAVPGVPIVYVKRSVMVLEPMSSPSEDVREGVEKTKLRAGIDGPEQSTAGAGEKRKSGKKVKGPNPLSVKKPKKRHESGLVKPREEREGEGSRDAGEGDDGDAAPKPKRKRRHHRSAKPDEAGQSGAAESSD